MLGSFKALAIPVTLFGGLDATRKAVPGTPIPKFDGTWSVSIPNVQPGSYHFFVGADFSEIGSATNIKKKAAMKKVTVSQ